MIDVYIDEPGTYTNLNGQKVLVACPDVTIQNSSPIHLFISPGVGRGSVNIDAATGNSSGESFFCVVGISHSVLTANVSIASLDFTQISTDGFGEDSRFTGGEGTSSNPYRISNATQLALLNEYNDRIQHVSFCFVLDQDITFQEEWIPIHFAGQFDGRGHTIKNMKVRSTTEDGNVFAGLFSRIESGSSVKNLTVQGEIIVADSDQNDFIGGIAGWVERGTISNCHTDVNISSGAHFVRIGGIAGFLSGKIENCSSSGKINAVSKTSAPESVRTGSTLAATPFNPQLPDLSEDAFRNSIGGIAGSVWTMAVIEGCKASSVITVSTVPLSGHSAENHVGGICGTLRGTVENSIAFKPGMISLVLSGFADEKTIAQGGVGGIAGTIRRAGNVLTTGSTGKIISCNADINVHVSGGDHIDAGGLVGAVMAGNVSDPVITRSFATGQAKAENGYSQNCAGGFVGHMEGGVITECFSGGSAVTAGYPYRINAVGGFLGAGYEVVEDRGENIIRDCYATASASSSGGTAVMGGFAGRVFGTLENCYSAGTSEAYSFVGGIGIAAGDATFRHCGDFLDNARGYPLFTSLMDGKETITQVSYGELTNASTFTVRNWDFNSVWMLSTSGNYGFPILRNIDAKVQIM